MAVNRYPGRCAACGGKVPAKGGKLVRSGSRAWLVYHLACEEGQPGVFTVRTSSGWEGTQNRRGRCEDAPCCGCCTF